MAGDDRPDDRPRLADFDISRPNIARVYDAFLGGKDNFAADREFVASVVEIAPKAPLAAKANRQFLAGWCVTWWGRQASRNCSTSGPACPPRAT
jgi:S-adenosyl methyltransferase